MPRRRGRKPGDHSYLRLKGVGDPRYQGPVRKEKCRDSYEPRMRQTWWSWLPKHCELPLPKPHYGWPQDPNVKVPNLIHDRRMRVAYTIDYRGDYDDQLTFLFIGANYRIIKLVFRWLIMHRVIKRAWYTVEENPYPRNGHHDWRDVITVEGLDEHLCTLDSLCLLIERRFHEEAWMYCCRRLPLQKFLNT